MKKITLLCYAILFCTGSNLLAQQIDPINSDWRKHNTFDHTDHPTDPCKVFIGVTTQYKNDDGLTILRVIENTPAQQYGLQVGDIIRTFDGTAVKSQPELENARDKHTAGDAFTLAIVRNGQEMTINARFKSCTAAEREQSNAEIERALERENNCQKFVPKSVRPILGIYPDDNQAVSNGVVVASVITGKGAEKAGLLSGDIITQVAGKDMAIQSIGSALDGLKPGEKVSVTYLRDGKTLQTEVVLSADRSYAAPERDPCAVFIGVYTVYDDNGVKGARVTGVIDNTPAKTAGVQNGDLIIALDRVPINAYSALTRERDKHQPGDAFQLTLLRNGKQMTVGAKFKTCDKNKPAQEEVVTLAPEIAPRNGISTLNLTRFNLSPNPSFGLLDIQFEGEAVPTTVTISDLSGKIVYTQALNQFGGVFSEQIDLSNVVSGQYILNIRQGNKVQTKQFALMARD